MLKRVLSMLLVCVMLVGMLPMQAFAEEADTPQSAETTAPAETTGPEETEEAEETEETTVPETTKETAPETEEETQPDEYSILLTSEDDAEDSINDTSLDTSNLTFSVNDPDGYVTVSFTDNGIRPEGAYIPNAELYGTAVGTIIPATEVPYVSGDSVADVTVRLLNTMGLDYDSTGTAADGFYLSALKDFELNGTYYPTFGEFDAGSQSGWCVRVNNWHINQGSSAVEVEDEDVITWLYTCQYGADIGADFSSRSADITNVVLTDSSLSLKEGEDGGYICEVPSGTSSIAFEVMLENYASIVTITVDGTAVKYRPNKSICVTPNSTIVISSELEYMDAANNNQVTTYTDSVTIQLTEKTANRAPIVSETAPSNLEAVVGEEITVTLSGLFTDTDDDDLTYHVKCEALGIDTDVSGSVFTGTVPTAGTYAFVVTASDGEESVSHTVTLNVTAASNNAPTVMEGAPTAMTAYIGEEISVDMSQFFTDADGDALTYNVKIPDLNVNETLEGSVYTGTIPTAGTYSVQLTANDGNSSVSHTVTLTVTEKENTAPNIKAAYAGTKSNTYIFSTSYVYIYMDDIFEDADGDALTYKATLNGEEAAITYNSYSKKYYILFNTKPAVKEYKIWANDGQSDSEVFTAKCIGTSAAISAPEDSPLLPGGNDYYYVKGSAENDTFALNYTLDVDETIATEWVSSNTVLTSNGNGTFTVGDVTSRQSLYVGVTAGKDTWGSALYLGTKNIYILPSMPAVADVTAALAEHADNQAATVVSNAFTGWYATEFEYEVADPSICDVATSGSYGLSITPKALGSTTVTATFKYDDSVKCSFTVTVTGRSLQIKDQPGSDDVIFADGKAVQLEVLGAEDSETFTWTSSDESVATVDSNGLVTLKSLGQTYITAASSLSTGDAEIKASMYLQVKESGKVYLDDIAITDYSYFDGFISAKSAFNSAQLTYNWNLSETRYTYNKLAFTPYFNDERLDAVLHYQVSGGEYQTVELTDSTAVSIANGLNPGDNVVKIDVYPTDNKDNVTSYTFNIFRPYNPTKTITGMVVYPNGETALSYPTYQNYKEGTLFRWNEETNDFVTGWNSSPTTGWTSTYYTYKTYIYGARTSTVSFYPTFGYTGERVMMYVNGEEYEEAVTAWKCTPITIGEEGATIAFHVNSEKYHAEQLAAGVEDPFAEPEQTYTIYVENVTPLGIDAKILSAELDGGEFYRPGFSSDSYTISGLIPSGETTANLTFTVPAGVDVYKTSVSDVNKLTTEKADEDGNQVYTTPILTITGSGSSAYSTTNIILQVTDEDGNVGKTQYAFTVSQRGAKDIYPDSIVEYLCLGSQYTNGSAYGTMPERTLKANGGVLSLGNFGGYIVYKYDTPIQNSPNNPYGVDFVIYGNSFGNGGHEPGYVQVSQDGETWYTLAGSEHFEDHNDCDYTMTYTNVGGKSSWTNSDGESGTNYNYPIASAYPYFSWTEALEQSITVSGPRLNSSAKDAYGSAAAVLPAFGYVDVNTNGTINGTSNNPYNHPGTLVAGGDQFDLDWAVDDSGMPVSLDSISYIRIATASSIYAGAIGEKSTEVTAVTRVTNAAESAVGVTAAPNAITVNGNYLTIPENGGKLSVVANEDEEMTIAVTAAGEGTNIYIGNTGSAERTYSTIPEKGIVRIIVQEGEKEPYICYLVFRDRISGTAVDVTWGSFGNNDTNNRITSAATPGSIDYTKLNWAKSYGNKPSLQILVDNALVFMSGTTLYKVSLADGSVLDSAQMEGSSAYTYIAPTYGGGMIFCALNGGKVQAFDADSLESLWVFTDELGGQDQVPITYADGYVYTGFWSGETAKANYVCIDVSTGSKVWTLSHTGGFYWAGSVVVGDAVIFGSDDGASGAKGDAALYSVNRKTGNVISTLTLTGLGDQRSTVVYDSGRIYFTTKGGYLCSAAVSADGALSNLKSVKAAGVFASTCTPVVYGSNVYYGASSKYFVIADKDTLETKHTVTLKGYSQHSSLLSTAYVGDDGYLYFYTTYNAKPGGISLIKVDADATDLTADDACQQIELYDAKGYEEYCISGVITDGSGNLCYKNDSGCIFSVGKTNVAVPQFSKNLSTEEVKYNYQKDTEAQTMIVEVIAADAGVLTYQWQSSTDGASWTNIDGAVSAAYVPGIAQLGTTYYRCVVTNTLDGTSETAVSEAAKILVKTFSGDTSIAYVVTNSNAKPSAAATAVTKNPTVINTSGNSKPRVWIAPPTEGAVTVEQVVGTDAFTIADSSGYKRIYFSAGVTQPNHLKVMATAEDETQTIYYLIVTADGVYTPASGTVTVTLSNAGQVVVAQQQVEAADRNGDGSLNVDEVLYAAHEAAFSGGAAVGYASAYSQYGLGVTKLWGNTSGAYGYWLNDASCWSLEDTVAENDSLVAFVYQDATYWSDIYSKFGEEAYIAADELTVTLEKAGYDANWNTVFSNHPGAVLTAYDSNLNALASSAYTVKDNGDGSYTVSFSESGEYYLIAADTDPILVPAVCRISFYKSEDVEKIYKTTGDYLSALSTPAVGATNGEWRVIGLTRSGREVADGYFSNVVSYVQSNINENEQLNAHKSTDNSRLILALTAIGKDVTDVGGHNLLKGLSSMSYVTYQGINGPIWALLAFDSHDYTIPSGDVTREKLVYAILNAQLSDGGWALSGTASDADLTGMALQALAPYYNTNAAVKTAVDKALSWLSGVQRADGSYAGADGVGAESLAQVITALTALGINPEEDARFIKNGLSAIDALAEFYVEGGGFKHILSSGLDMMATEQSYYALASYFRLLKGKTSLYDMTDVKLDSQAIAEVEALIDAIGTPITLDSKGAIEAARTAYDALTSVQKTLVDNHDALKAAETAYAQLVKTAEDEAAADAVEAKIAAIGTPVTLDSEKAITAARTAYDALTATRKALVENADVLEKAEAALKLLKDTAAADKVEALIDAIGNNITTGSTSAINAARKAYDALTADQKELVENYQKLVNAEAKLRELNSTISVSFTLLGCYKHGSGETSVHTLAGGNLSTWISTATIKVTVGATVKDVFEKALTAAGMSWSNPTGNYVESINGIGEFTNGKYSGWMYTLNGSHPNLGVAQQTVVNGDVIVFHYTDDYTKEDSAQGYKNYSDEETANAVEKLIKDIGTEITLDSEAKIAAAREAYEKLTAAQKKLVENYDDLVAAEKALAELKNAVGEDVYKTTGDYLESLGTPNVGAVGGEWMVIGLARSGRDIPAAYYDNVVAYVNANINENQQLHSNKSTDNARVILALTAIGKDATDVDGHDLLAGLTDMDYVCKQGINGPIWTLIAFDSGNYPIPEGDVTREKLIETILEAQLSDGGWALSGSTADPDMTGMAVQALAPYCDVNSKVKNAVEDAVWAMSRMQSDNGSYSSVDGASSESIAQIIVALSALGIDADTDARFIKNGTSAWDALLTYYVQGGGFRHILSGKLDGMATEQAYYAMAAYYRMRSGKTALYDMTEVIDLGGDAEVEETTQPTEIAAEVNETGDDSGFPWWSLVLVISAGAITVLFINRKKIFKLL